MSREDWHKGTTITAYTLKDFQNMLVQMEKLEAESLGLANDYSRHILPLLDSTERQEPRALL